MVYTSTKDYLKYNERDAEPVHIFPSGSVGRGKSHLMKVFYTEEFVYLDLKNIGSKYR